MIIPSLSVLQTFLSLRKKLAPALSSPPKNILPSINGSTNHLNPTGVSYTFMSLSLQTLSIIELLTSVFPIPSPEKSLFLAR